MISSRLYIPTLLSVLPLITRVNGARTVPALPAGWTYVGCISEVEGHKIMSVDYTYSDDMTGEKCVSLCNILSKDFAGLEEGGECYCTSAINRFEPAGEERCDYPCGGDEDDVCGGEVKGFMTFYSKADKVPQPAGTASTEAGSPADSAPAPSSADAGSPVSTIDPAVVPTSSSQSSQPPANTSPTAVIGNSTQQVGGIPADAVPVTNLGGGTPTFRDESQNVIYGTTASSAQHAAGMPYVYAALPILLTALAHTF